MITIPLPGNGPLTNAISYSVSPLYELAASLHTLAQQTPPNASCHGRKTNWNNLNRLS